MSRYVFPLIIGALSVWFIVEFVLMLVKLPPQHHTDIVKGERQRIATTRAKLQAKWWWTW
jgi:hypothetical protein